MNIKGLFFGDYEADSELIDSNAEGRGAFGYEELHLSDEMIEQLKNGKDLEVCVQNEYILRIMYGEKETESEVKGE